jgi:hypothetical protein
MNKYNTILLYKTDAVEEYVVWWKSNETGNAVHKPTKLLPSPSHGN